MRSLLLPNCERPALCAFVFIMFSRFNIFYYFPNFFDSQNEEDSDDEGEIFEDILN